MKTYDRMLDEFIASSSKVLAQIGGLAAKPKALAWKNRVLLRGALDELGKGLREVFGDDCLNEPSGCSVTDAKSHAGAVKVFRYKIQSAGIRMFEAATKGAWDLRLQEVPDVFDIRQCVEGEEHDIVNFKSVLGLYHKERNEVYVASGLGYRDSLETLGHELWHAKERQEGRTCDEAAADDYGRRFADWITYGTHT